MKLIFDRWNGLGFVFAWILLGSVALSNTSSTPDWGELGSVETRHALLEETAGAEFDLQDGKYQARFDESSGVLSFNHVTDGRILAVVTASVLADTGEMIFTSEMLTEVDDLIAVNGNIGDYNSLTTVSGRFIVLGLEGVTTRRVVVAVELTLRGQLADPLGVHPSTDWNVRFFDVVAKKNEPWDTITNILPFTPGGGIGLIGWGVEQLICNDPPIPAGFNKARSFEECEALVNSWRYACRQEAKCKLAACAIKLVGALTGCLAACAHTAALPPFSAPLYAACVAGCMGVATYGELYGCFKDGLNALRWCDEARNAFIDDCKRHSIR